MRYAPTEVRSRAAVVSRRLRTGAPAAPGTCGAGRTSWDVRYWGERALVDAAMISLWRQESAALEVVNERELCRLQERVGFFRELTLSFVRPAAAESRAATHGAATHGAAAHRAAIHGSATRGAAAPGQPPAANKQNSHFPSSILGASARFHNAWFSIRPITHRLRRTNCHFAEDQLPFHPLSRGLNRVT